MKKAVFTLLLLCLISATPALARIGETRAQCAARYGAPVLVNEKEQGTIHEKAGLQVACHFHEDKCDWLDFRKIEKDAEGHAVALSEVERKILLEASSGGRPWTERSNNPKDGIISWICGGLQAIYVFDEDCYLHLSTSESRTR